MLPFFEVSQETHRFHLSQKGETAEGRQRRDIAEKFKDWRKVKRVGMRNRWSDCQPRPPVSHEVEANESPVVL